MSDDSLDLLAATTTYRGRATWSKKVVDIEVAELPDDQRLAATLRSAAGIFSSAQMPYTANLLRHAARSLDPPSEWLNG